MNIRTFEEELRQHLKVRAGLMPNERYANSGNEAEARLWRSKEMDSKEKEMATFPYLQHNVFVKPYEYLRAEFYIYVTTNPPRKINAEGEDAETVFTLRGMEPGDHWLREDVGWKQKLETLMAFVKGRNNHEDFAEQMKVLRRLIFLKCGNLDNMSMLDAFLARFNMDLNEVKKLPCQGWTIEGNRVVASRTVNSTFGESVPAVMWSLIAFIGACPNREQIQKLIMAGAELENWPQTEGLIRRYFRHPHELATDTSKSRNAGYSAAPKAIEDHEMYWDKEAEHLRKAYSAAVEVNHGRSEVSDVSKAAAHAAAASNNAGMGGYQLVRPAADDCDILFGTEVFNDEETVWEQCYAVGGAVKRFSDRGPRTTFKGKQPRAGPGFARCYKCGGKTFDRVKKECNTKTCGHKAGDKDASANMAVANNSDDEDPFNDPPFTGSFTATAACAVGRPTVRSPKRQVSLPYKPSPREMLHGEREQDMTVEIVDTDSIVQLPNGGIRMRKRRVDTGPRPAHVNTREPLVREESSWSSTWSVDEDNLAALRYKKKEEEREATLVVHHVSWKERAANWIRDSACLMVFIVGWLMISTLIYISYESTFAVGVAACEAAEYATVTNEPGTAQAVWAAVVSSFHGAGTSQ
jgi:hypothetical protein